MKVTHAKRVILLLLIFTILLPYTTTAQQLPNFTKLAKKALPAVVNISTTQIIKTHNPFPRFQLPFDKNSPFYQFFNQFNQFFNQPQTRKVYALGSGFIISPDGYILTNYHVIKHATTIQVRLLNNNQFYKARVVGVDPEADIALIKIKPREKLPTLQLGDSSKIQIGQWVIAVGNPFGLNGTVTAGIISAKGRVIGTSPIDHFLQTDAAINPGNSGGPLINMQGKVIGMNTAIIEGGTGIGFAIPSNMIKEELPYLMKGEKVKRGYIGVDIEPITPSAARALGLHSTNGAIITQVFSHTGAAKAGLKPGDIIVSVNGKKITSANELPYMISIMRPGTKIKLGILRNGKRITKIVTLGVRPSKTQMQKQEEKEYYQPNSYKTHFGFSISNITLNLRERFHLKEHKGIVITHVNPNSFAYMAGVRPGDVIKAVNYHKVYSVREFKKVLSESRSKNVIFLTIRRGNTTIFLSIQK